MTKGIKLIILKFTTLIGTALLVFGCEPRGETATLESIYQNAKENFLAAPSSNNGQLDSLKRGMEEFVGSPNGSSMTESAINLAKELDQLIMSAGHTSRPAIFELSSQLRSFKATDLEEQNTAKAKLLASRVFALLTSELSTTAFQLVEEQK